MFFPKFPSKRKEKGSLPVNLSAFSGGERTSPFISGSLTLEAACTFPLFLAAMIAVMYFIMAVITSVKAGQGLHEAGRQMAVLAYAKEAVDVDVSDQVTGALSLL